MRKSALSHVPGLLFSFLKKKKILALEQLSLEQAGPVLKHDGSFLLFCFFSSLPFFFFFKLLLLL